MINTFVTGLKKITTILIAVVYLAVTCGIVINMHYCMGKLAGISYHATAQSNHCDNCGMDDSDCCNDHLQVVQFDNVQNSVATIDYKLPALKPILQEHHYLEAILLQNLSTDIKQYSDSPPEPASQPLSILYCTFRI